jgi:3-dehydroquinate synthase
MKIKSYRKDYYVDFVEEISDNLLTNLSENGFLLIDSNIYNLYPCFKNAFDESKTFVVKACEQDKSFEYSHLIIERLVESGFKRNHKLIAVGGGITQDLAGFTSSILYRGVEWVFFPTTLLAQADSCIGSKTSINFGGAKNLIGTFHPPSKIYCFDGFLPTLKEDDIKSGIGEMLHYFLIEDTKLAENLMSQYDQILAGNLSLVSEHTSQSLKIKKKLIEKDEFDAKERKIFNYGHTFGHAIETLTNYSISHGRAVTLGIDLANFISYKLGFIKYELYNKLHKIIYKNIPTFTFKEEELNRYISLLSKDKKNVDKSIGCILLKQENKAELTLISDTDNLKQIIQEYFKQNEHR